MTYWLTRVKSRDASASKKDPEKKTNRDPIKTQKVKKGMII